MYVSYRIRGALKPEHVAYVSKFVKEFQWSEQDTPPCISRWHAFLKDHGKYKVMDNVVFYENRIPFGLPSEWWGCECVVYEDEFGTSWWSFSGEMKNDCKELEFFTTHVVCELCYHIPICWTCKEGDTLFTTHNESDVRDGKFVNM